MKVTALSFPSSQPPSKPREILSTRSIGPCRVSPIGLGTWSWGNKFLWSYSPKMDPELQACFNYAVKKGINLFDTADSYGTGTLNGRSEILLGQFMREYGGDEEIHIATKFAAYPWRVLPRNITAACQGSLRRLQMDSLSLGQLHWSAANYAPLQELALQNGLVQIYRKGLVRAVGVSNYGPKQLLKIYHFLEKRGVPLSSAQIQFSLLSYGPEQRDLLQLCKELNISVIAYSPLALGLLTSTPLCLQPFSLLCVCVRNVDKFRMDRLPSGPRGGLFKNLLPKIQDVICVLEEISAQKEKTAAQVAINWCLSKETIPIPGVKSLTQAQDNLGCLDWSLTSDEVEELDTVAGQTEGKMLQNIFQTK